MKEKDPLRITFDAENEARKTLAQIIGGIFVLAALYIAWQRVELTREDQATDRFIRAVDQLGKTEIEVRLGAIYSLERLARTSPKDHWTIMEVLTAYVRHRAPWKGEKEQPELVGEPLTSQNAQEEEAKYKPAIDIQAALTVIGRRNLKNEGENTPRLDLGSTDLRGADLRGAHLEKVVLRMAHLENADLRGVHLENADLWRANLEKANLRGSFLEKAFLRQACMDNADLREARLDGADLRGGHLKEADLRGAHLEGANLQSARLEEADLCGAYLGEAFLWRAHLEGANLDKVEGLTQKQLMNVILDKETILPEYLRRPEEIEG